MLVIRTQRRKIGGGKAVLKHGGSSALEMFLKFTMISYVRGAVGEDEGRGSLGRRAHAYAGVRRDFSVG